MSVLIKGMAMPTSCYDCPIGDELCCSLMPGVPALWKEYAAALKTNRRHEDCPLVELPPHGRLIDADVALRSEQPSNVTDDQWSQTTLARCIINAPTIIEAENE